MTIYAPHRPGDPPKKRGGFIPSVPKKKPRFTDSGKTIYSAFRGQTRR